MQDVAFDSLAMFHCKQCGEPIKADVLEPFSSTVCPLCQAQNTVPAKFGPFLLQERIGDGIMSVVFQALDPQLDRKISIKVLNYVLSKNQDLVEAFKREALAAAALSAHNVLKVYEFGIHNGQPFMVMEAIEGVYLNELLRRESLDASEILAILDGLARGLRETHEAGLVHGEVMPRNILIDKQNTPKLCEFGLARFSHESANDQPTWSSPYYMPPERILGQPEDHRGDIYSLGTTLFQMLTGHLPFFDMDDEVVRSRKISEPAPEVLAVNPEADPDLAALTARMIAPNPDDRLASWDALLQEIEAIAPAVRRRTPLGDSSPSAQHLQPPRKPFPWLMALILLLGAAAGTGIFLFDRNQRELQAAQPTPLPLPTVHRRYGAETTFRHTPPTGETKADPPTPGTTRRLLFHLRAMAPEEGASSRQGVWADLSGTDHAFRQKQNSLRPEWFGSAMDGEGALLFDRSILVSTFEPRRHKAFTLGIVAQDLGSLDDGGNGIHVLLGVDPAAANSPRFLLYFDKNHPGQLCFETEDGFASLPLTPQGDRKHFTAAISVRNGLPDLAAVNGQSATLSGGKREHDMRNPAALPFLQLGGLSGQECYFSGFVSEIVMLPEALPAEKLRAFDPESFAMSPPAE